MVEDINEISKEPESDRAAELDDFLREVLTHDEANKNADRNAQVTAMAIMIADHPDVYGTEEEIEYAISIAAKNDSEKRLMEDIIDERVRNRKS
ncbi:MAG: hypothetical protein QG639_299 [Patescibacteria group bacterium]|jgi:hypothetical protein|nr:hypothetical protein [Patescibacteria group bacterium]